MSNEHICDATTEEVQKENSLLRKENAELTTKLNWFMEQFNLNQQRRFGSSSEQTMSEQLNLFNEAESETKPDLVEPTIEEIIYKRKKKIGKRDIQLEDLPTETIDYKLLDEQRVCACCGGKLHEMSTQVRRELKIVPAQFSVINHVQYIYACRNCEREEMNTPIITVPMPKPVIPGSLASPSTIAHVISQKFVEGMPLYRQEKQFERLGVEISRQTLANWMIQSSQRWLCTIYDRMKEHLIKKDILHADETTLQVLNEPDRPADSKSYMWLYRTGRDGPPIILFDYQTTRAGKHPERFLSCFKGYLHVDGYAGYNVLSGVILVACWAHARRKFNEALQALPVNKRDLPGVTKEGINFCNQLFTIERDLKESTSEQRYDGRRERSRPVLDAFLVWLKYQRPRVLPKSAFGIAIQYCLNQWDKLGSFMLDGRLEIDNNRAERSIKPFVIGRKNWLFSNSMRGASSSATSIVETAKENGLNPFMYLKYLFEKLPNMDLDNKNEIDNILPWSADLPENCKVKKGANLSILVL